MRWFRRGRHRATRWTPSVFEVIDEARRIPVTEVQAMRNEVWSRRGEVFTRTMFHGYAAPAPYPDEATPVVFTIAPPGDIATFPALFPGLPEHRDLDSADCSGSLANLGGA